MTCSSCAIFSARLRSTDAPWVHAGEVSYSVFVWSLRFLICMLNEFFVLADQFILSVLPLYENDIPLKVKQGTAVIVWAFYKKNAGVHPYSIIALNSQLQGVVSNYIIRSPLTYKIPFFLCSNRNNYMPYLRLLSDTNFFNSVQQSYDSPSIGASIAHHLKPSIM